MRDRRAPLAFQGVTLRRQLKGADRPTAPPRPAAARAADSSAGRRYRFIDPRNSIRRLDALDACRPGWSTSISAIRHLRQLERTVSAARRPAGRTTWSISTATAPTCAHRVGALAFEDGEARPTW